MVIHLSGVLKFSCEMTDSILTNMCTFMRFLSLKEEELFSLALSIPPYPASLGIHSSAYATVTITDDDFLTVQFAESSYSVSEGAGEVVLILTANGTSAVNYTVVVDTVDGSATGKHSSSVKWYS